MTNNFKQGDLALTLISLPAAPAGSVVQLNERVMANQIFEIKGVGTFLSKDTGWLCSHGGQPHILAYADKSLMPLRGDFEPEQQKAKEAEPCA
ncbi:hypothetical protein [Pseudomonas moraviensis]|uniref:hypothetical protein n=1 Tax=Pseudomonas moraviensis TaxID=321662 RepID=UPI002E35E4ED|nr:hypothetical protein [Pseudomonas moraviensis]